MPPPKIIYRPPISVKNKLADGQIGTREKSERKRTKKQVYQADLPINKKLTKRLKRQNTWTAKEKPIIIKKIRENGSGDTSLLLDPELNKTEDQIKDLIQFYRKGNRMKETIRINPTTSMTETVYVPREISSNIDSWISLAESHRNPPGSGLMDCSHILGDTMSVIINEEKHPKPEDCLGIDYAEIYRYLNSLLSGDVPKMPDQATARKILEMMGELKETVKTLTENGTVQDHLDLFEKYNRRDIGILSGPFEGKCNDSEIKTTCAMPKMNPLHLPPAFFTAKILSKESKTSGTDTQE